MKADSVVAVSDEGNLRILLTDEVLLLMGLGLNSYEK